MTDEEEVLGRVIRLFEQLSIPYMVTGSIAAAYHGRPRAKSRFPAVTATYCVAPAE